MEIIQFTFTEPDEDNDVNLNLEINITNESNKTIELISSCLMVLNKDDVCVGGSGIDFIDTHIDPREKDTVSVDCGWNYSASLFGNDLNKMKGKLSLDLHSKKFMKIGKLDVPKSRGVSSIKNKLSIDNFVNIYGVILEKEKIDEDGTSSIIIKVGLENISEANIPKVKIRSILFDLNGDIIDDRDNDSEIVYRSSNFKN